MLTVKLKDGLGNRLFQVAALLGYAEKWGLEPVFFPGRTEPCKHDGSETIYSLFPHIRVEWNLGPAFETVSERATDCFTYVERVKPTTTDPIVLDGYFQAVAYGPTIEPVLLNYERLLSKERRAEIGMYYRSYDWWIHVRLGDYMLLPHYQIGLEAYLREAMKTIPVDTKVVVYSDSMECALDLVRGLREDIAFVGAGTLSAVETLYAMSLATGGCICTNSTFGWWGAYGSRMRCGKEMSVYFPGTWTKLPYSAEDIYPVWATSIHT